MRWLAILLLLPFVAADSFELTLPEELDFGKAVWLVGHIEVDETDVIDPVFVNPSRFQGLGALTACPVDFSTGTIPTVLSTLGADCVNGQSFTNPDVRFGERARIVGTGNHSLEREPKAGMLTAGSNGDLAWSLSSDGIRLQDGPFAFAPTQEVSRIVVESDEQTREFNGTDWAFFFETDSLWATTSAIGFQFTGKLSFQLNEVEDMKALTSSLDPYQLLEVQELMFGADAREPRINVSRVFKEFGRVPDYVNGALLGYLNGTAADKTYSAKGPTLIRGETFVGNFSSSGAEGTYQEVLALGPSGVAFDGHGVSSPPWGWIVFGFVVAAVVAFVRRHTLRNGLKVKLGLGLFAGLGLLIVDQSVMLGRTGTSALQQATQDATLGTIFALLVFELLILLSAFLLILLPWRFAVLKWVPGKMQWFAQVPILGIWLLVLWRFPGPLFALTYLFARL